MSKIKPGSLCEVVGYIETPGLKGRFVVAIEPQVIGMSVDGILCLVSEPAWICEGASSGATLPTILDSGRLVELRKRPIATKVLRPINDPGEDAQDETLLWLDVPSAEKVDA